MVKPPIALPIDNRIASEETEASNFLLETKLDKIIWDLSQVIGKETYLKSRLSVHKSVVLPFLPVIRSIVVVSRGAIFIEDLMMHAKNYYKLMKENNMSCSVDGYLIYLENNFESSMFNQERYDVVKGENIVIPKLKSYKTNIPNTKATDDVISRVGKIIREIKVDELPQLELVVKKQLALVGYRPLSVSELKEINTTLYNSVGSEKKDMKVAITGPAMLEQIQGVGENGVLQESMTRRTELMKRLNKEFEENPLYTDYFYLKKTAEKAKDMIARKLLSTFYNNFRIQKKHHKNTHDA